MSIQLNNHVNTEYNIDESIQYNSSQLLPSQDGMDLICKKLTSMPFSNTEQLLNNEFVSNIPPRVEERIDTNSSNIPARIVKTIPYQGSLPTPIPNEYAFSNYNNKYVGGLVNPIKRETLITTLILNSKFRDFYINNIDKKEGIYNAPEKYKYNNYDTEKCYEEESFGQKGTTTDFVVELEEPFSNVISMRLSGLELVNGYYSISEYLGTNVFSININDPSGNKLHEYIIKIPDGVYNIDNLVKNINCFFTMNHIHISVDYDELSQKLFFQLTSHCHDLFEIDFRNPYNIERNLYYNLGWMLGFRKQKYTFEHDSIHFHHTDGIFGETSVNFIGTSFFLLCVDDFNNNYSKVVSYNPGTKYSHNIRNVLATIPNSVQTNEILFEDSADRINKRRQYFGPVSIKKLHINILDEYGRPLNNTHADLSIKLEIETLNSPHKNIIS